MKKTIIVPDSIPAERHEQYREFVLCQLVQQLLIDHGATIVQSQKVLSFVASRCSWQLKEPEAVAFLGNNFMNSYKDETNSHYSNLYNTPVNRLRAESLPEFQRKLAIAQDMKRPVEANITDELFAALEPSQVPSRIITQ
jgi:hypothetical protein